MAYRDIILASGPVFYHEMKNTSPAVKQQTGNLGFTSITFNTDGPKNTGGSAVFNGTSSFMEIPNLFDFYSSSAWVFECWVKYGPQTMDYPTFMRRDNNNSTYLVRSRAPQVGRSGDIESYYTGRSDYFSSSFADNAWHHVFVTKWPSGYQLIVDGNPAPQAGGTIGGSAMGTTAPTYIGKGSGATEFFQGQIAHVAFYNKELTGTDLQNRVNAPNDVIVTSFQGWGIQLP